MNIMTTVAYKPGNYMVNGNKMYFDGTNWFDVNDFGVRTLNNHVDALGNPIAGWTEPTVLQGGSFSVAYSFSHIGPADTVHICVAVGSMSLGIFHEDASWFSPNITINNDATPQPYTGTFTLALTGDLAKPPVNYSMYVKVMKSTITDETNFLATSPTYDNAMNFIAAGYTLLTITAVTKVTTP
jgi:hypothetical protein